MIFACAAELVAPDADAEAEAEADAEVDAEAEALVELDGAVEGEVRAFATVSVMAGVPVCVPAAVVELATAALVDGGGADRSSCRFAHANGTVSATVSTSKGRSDLMSGS